MTEKYLRAGRLIGAFVLATVMLVLLAVIPASASDIRTGSSIVIAAGEVIDDDLIVSAETVQIDGTVRGDLIATGTTLIVNGTVEGSAALAGQSLRMLGNVDGSVYATSFDLTVGESAVVGRNLYYGGFSLDLNPGSTVGRSVYAGTSQVVADGTIGGDLVVGSNALELRGSVGGDVLGDIAPEDSPMMPMGTMPNMPAIEQIAPGLRIDPASTVGGTVDVQQTERIPESAQPETGFLGLPNWFTDRLGEFIGLVIIGAIMIYVTPRILPLLDHEIRSQPWQSLGWGALIMLVLFPVAIVAGGMLVVLLTAFFGVITFGELTGAVLTLSGSFLAFLFFAFLFVAYLVAKVIVGYFVGRWLLSRVDMDPASKWTQLAYVALGVLLYELLRAIPVAGWIISLLVTFFGVGVIMSYWLTKRRASSDVQAKLESVS